MMWEWIWMCIALIEGAMLIAKEGRIEQLNNKIEKLFHHHDTSKHDRNIPKKLSYEGDGYADGQLVYDTAICPNCERRFDVDYEEHYDYCPECGQRLDWSVDEQEDDSNA